MENSEDTAEFFSDTEFMNAVLKGGVLSDRFRAAADEAARAARQAAWSPTATINRLSLETVHRVASLQRGCPTLAFNDAASWSTQAEIARTYLRCTAKMHQIVALSSEERQELLRQDHLDAIGQQQDNANAAVMARSAMAPTFDAGQFIRSLSQRGVNLLVASDGGLLAGQGHLLNDHDRVLLKAHRGAMVAVLQSVELVA